MNKGDKIFLVLVVVLSTLAPVLQGKCAYQLDPETMIPYKTDLQPHLQENLQICKQYNGKMGCCTETNDRKFMQSYATIDIIFGNKGGGCDLCAVNLKRFWCQYTCSPRQHQFLQVSEGYTPVPDPQKPGQTITVQKVKVTIESDTACDMFNSCKRVPFVSSVSAMGSPAGFLIFQGRNAVDDAHQYIDVDFSANRSNSLFFSNDNQEIERKKLSLCNVTTDMADNGTIHQFDILKNCSCNTCQLSCNSDNGFVYTQSSILEGFNYVLVGSVWAGAILISLAFMFFKRNSK